MSVIVLICHQLLSFVVFRRMLYQGVPRAQDMANIERRVSKTGETSYRVKVRLKGHATQSGTFKRLTDARKWVQDTESAIRAGRHFKTSEAKRHTLGDLIDRYIREVLPRKPKSKVDQGQQLSWWKAQLGPRTLADITPAVIAEWRDRLASDPIRTAHQDDSKEPHSPRYRSPSTVARYLAALSHAFTIAVKEWGWLEDSPLRKVAKPKEPRGRVRFLSDEERRALLKACQSSANPDLYVAVVLALSTGARRMEILGMRWSQVDIARGVITVTETKNGEIRALPLVGLAHDLMKERAKVRRIGTDLVFPSKQGVKPVDLRAPWEAALSAAKIADFRWHDLRHSCASYLAMNGATLPEIAEVLGHKTLQMVKRYAHLSHAHTSRVVESMNAKIFG